MAARPIPIDSIRPNPDNPRTVTLKVLTRLSASIRRDPEFMRLRPIIVDEAGIILAGNQRYVACRDIGYADLPPDWVKVARDLTPEARARLIILDNDPPGMTGHWDVDILLADWSPQELGELGVDLTKYGITDLTHMPGHLGHGEAPPAPPTDETVWKHLRVHFHDSAALKDFNRRTGLSVTEETDRVRFE